MLKLAVRNLGGALHPGNRYRNRQLQAEALADAMMTGAEVLLLQEVTGVGRPFEVPPGWHFDQPYSKADRGGASVVIATQRTDIDLTWRPAHRVLDAFGAYLDFGLLHEGDGDIALVSVHATGWRPELWVATGSTDAMPGALLRPWPSDVLLDTLVEVLGDRPAVLAGDWNEDPDYPHQDDKGAAAFQQRAADAGFVEAVSATFKGKVRTNFSHQTQKSYQNDRVFVTESLAPRLRSVSVWHELHAPLSDHAGITVTFGS
jgi:endonuclease/exonuclease/phosphatase family metal-dependent hydrolase